jgi:hypothetical protein
MSRAWARLADDQESHSIMASVTKDRWTMGSEKTKKQDYYMVKPCTASNRGHVTSKIIVQMSLG